MIRKGGKVGTIPLAPRTARAIDLAIGERAEGPLFLGGEGLSSCADNRQGVPLRIILGSRACGPPSASVKDRIAGFEAQAGLAASTDFPPGQ